MYIYIYSISLVLLAVLRALHSYFGSFSSFDPTDPRNSNRLVTLLNVSLQVAITFSSSFFAQILIEHTHIPLTGPLPLPYLPPVSFRQPFALLKLIFIPSRFSLILLYLYF